MPLRTWIEQNTVKRKRTMTEKILNRWVARNFRKAKRAKGKRDEEFAKRYEERLLS